MTTKLVMTMSKIKLRILLLSHVRPGHAGTSHDHERALADLSEHDVFVFSPVEEREWFPDLSNFDVVILHYSLIIWSENYLPTSYVQDLQNYRGLKVLFIQDEYRQVYNAVNQMERLRIDVLFTCYQPSNVNKIYGHLANRGTRIITTLTGYVPPDDVESWTVPLRERPLDVCYRSRPLPYTLGRLSQEKVFIASEFNRRAIGTPLRCDVDWREEQRIYGDDWIRFVASSRASLGTESGASIIDFTGDIDQAVRAYLETNPSASYDEVEREVLSPYEGKIVLNVISPRAFEAIRLRNALILFPGEYSGILVQDRHYIPLNKDFSNFDEVVAKLRDFDLLDELVDRTYDDIIGSGLYSYGAFAREVDQVLIEEWERRVRRPSILVPNHLPQVKERESHSDAPVYATREEWRAALLAQHPKNRAVGQAASAMPKGDPAIDQVVSPPRLRPLAKRVLRRILRLVRLGFERTISRLTGRSIKIHLAIHPKAE